MTRPYPRPKFESSVKPSLAFALTEGGLMVWGIGIETAEQFTRCHQWALQPRILNEAVEGMLPLLTEYFPAVVESGLSSSELFPLVRAKLAGLIAGLSWERLQAERVLIARGSPVG